MPNLFPQRLKEAREQLDMKQKEVQDKVGVNNRTLSGYENGKAEPDFNTLIKLSDLYNVSADWLLGREDKHVPTVKPAEETKIDLSDFSKEICINGRALNEEEKRKLAALTLILFG